jgi:hypothetical protein
MRPSRVKRRILTPNSGTCPSETPAIRTSQWNRCLTCLPPITPATSCNTVAMMLCLLVLQHQRAESSHQHGEVPRTKWHKTLRLLLKIHLLLLRAAFSTNEEKKKLSINLTIRAVSNRSLKQRSLTPLVSLTNKNSPTSGLSHRNQLPTKVLIYRTCHLLH